MTNININITIEEQSIINNILKNNLPESTEIFAFGSRAKLNNSKFSDLDLAINQIDNQKLSLEILAQLREEFEESDLIYKVDLIDLNNISSSFINSIKNDLVEYRLI